MLQKSKVSISVEASLISQCLPLETNNSGRHLEGSLTLGHFSQIVVIIIIMGPASSSTIPIFPFVEKCVSQASLFAP